MLDRPGAGGYLDDPQCRAAVSGAARLLESLGHYVAESAPGAMFEEELAKHFTNIVAADTEATLWYFEAMLGRPIGEDEIEPRTAFYPELGQIRCATCWRLPGRSAVPCGRVGRSGTGCGVSPPKGRGIVASGV